ncbi:MAG: Resolvase, N-terminal domain [Bryobacterales bacterium]|nr:Resolvase, N-terminal domain [Bryobacterales bacterium]
MTKAFAYLRVSGKSQLGGDGFTRQLQAIRDYAKAHDIRIVQVFRDEGVSGSKDLANRPAFVEMMTALYSNGTKLVLIERLDRLARDLMVQETIIGDLRKHDFGLVSVHEPDLLQDDPSRKLMRQVFGAIAEYEKTMIVLKLRGARERVRARGETCEGAKPFGKLAGESAVIARMCALRADGLGFDRIAAKLNAEGISPRRGRQWWGLTVNKILRANAVSR